MLIMHHSPEEGSDQSSLQKDTLKPNMLTMQVIAIMITVIICDFLSGYINGIILHSDLVKTMASSIFIVSG